MRGFIAGICLLAATACLGKATLAPTPIDRTVVLAPGQTVQVGGGASVGFVAVIGDSRCPIDAVCIQGGDAIVRVTLSTNGTAGQRDLHTGSMAAVTFEDLQIQLVELQPYPFSSRPFDPSEYRATVRVKR